MCRPSSLVLVLGAALAAVSSSDLAAAKPRDAAQTADADAGAEQFAEGRRLYKAGEFGKALSLFAQAFASSKSPNARLYLARTLRELGRLPEAYEEMRAALNDARFMAETQPRYVETRDAAASELALLEPKVGRLVIALSGDPSQARVSIDGVPVAKDKLGTVLVVTPGTKTIEAVSAGGTALKRTVQLAGGATETVTLSLEGGTQPAAGAAAKPAAGTEPQTAAEAEPETDGATQEPVRIAGYVVGGVGLATLVVFAVSAAQAKSSYDTLDEECGGQRCTELTYADEVDRGETMETLSHVTLAVGLAATVAGGLMVIFGGADEAPEQQAGLRFGPSRALVTYGARF